VPSSSMVVASPLALLSLEACLSGRRSRRDFGRDSLGEDDLLRLCWAGQGVTGPDGLRTAPSAGGIHPLELYAVSDAGVLHYDALTHQLRPTLSGDRRPALCAAAMSQDAVGLAAVSIVIVAVEGRMEPRYGARARRYELIEAGHVAQNILLAATAMGVSSVPVGALDDAAVRDVLELPETHAPLYIVSVGRPRPPEG